MKQFPHFISTIPTIFTKCTQKAILFCLSVAALLNPSTSEGQTVVSYTALTTITCPATPSATIAPSVSGLSFSQISRGGGVTCATAGGSISGSGFNGTLVTNISASKWYTFSVTSDASVSFSVSSLNIVSRVSNTTVTPNVSVQYSIGGSAPTTVIGSFTPTTAAVTYAITPSIPIAVGANQTLNIYIIPNSLTASTTTARVENSTSITVSTASTASPTISLSGSLSPLSTTYGTASSTASFGLTGSDMTNSIVVGPLSGFEFADNSVGSYFSTLTLSNSVSVSKTIDVRLAANTPFGTYSGNIPVTSTGASAQSISIGASNVNAKPITITGISANNKPFDGNTNATLSGTASLVGVETADISNVILGGSPVATFASSAIANGIAVTVSGYSISGSGIANYSLTQPTGLTANITATSLTPQVITFNALPDATYGDGPITLSATGGGSVNPVTYHSSNTNVGTIAGNILTIVGAGSTTITASQLGDGVTYDDAIPVPQAQLVNVKELTVSGGSANNKVYDGSNIASLNAGTLVGVVGLDDVTLNGTSGTFGSVNVAIGITVTSTYTLGGTTAPNYSLSQATYLADITPASQTITFNALSPKTFGNPNFALTATGGASGNPISYASDNTLVAVVAGDSIQIVGAGTANITASQAGNLNYNAAVDVIQSLVVNQATQNITFASLPNKTTDDVSFTLSASGGGSGNPVTFQSSDPLVASILGNVVTIVGVGTTNITASQIGNTNYLNANDIIRTLTVTCPIVAGWDMNPLSGGTNNFGTSPYPATLSSSNLTIGGLTRGSGVNATGTAAARGWGGLGWNNLTANDNINANKFITFTAKANSGYVLNLCSFNPFDYRRSSTGPPNGLLQYSNDGVNFVDITILNFTSTSSSGASAGVVDLSLIPAMQNVPSATTIIFRLVPYGASGSTGSFYLFDVANSTNNDFALTGTVNPCVFTFDTLSVSACDSYIWSVNGMTYNTSGTYTNVTACHTDVLNLAITTSLICQNGGTNNINCGCDCPSGFSGTNCEIAPCITTFGASIETGCNNVTWNSNTYTSSQTVIHTFVNAGGCDSVHTATIVVNNSNTGSSTETGCNSVTWNSNTYTTSQTVLHTFTNATGCDSVHTATIVVNYSSAGSSTETGCNSITWNGTTYTSSQIATHTFTNAAGCDSMHTATIVVNNNNTGVSTETGCNSVTWNGNTYTSSQTVMHTFTNVAGCDSVHTATIVVNNSNTGSSTETGCNSVTWNGNTYTTSQTVMHTFTNAAGCDSVHTATIVVNYSNAGSSTEIGCNSVTWNGNTYTTSQTVMHTFTNVAGCDSMHTATIVVNYSNTGSSSHTACDSYLWNGTTYTASGTPTHIYTNAAGCDSVHTLNLTINASTSNSTTASSCDSYLWSYNNVTYNTSGTYTATSLNGASCVHSEILVLTITTSTTDTLNVTECGAYNWAVNNVSYTASGTYSHVSGCHTSILNLTIITTFTYHDTVTSGGCYTWQVNGVTYSMSGNYTYTTTNISTGCAETFNLNLTIISGVKLAAKAILSGPYNSTTGWMHDSLRVLNLIPTDEPYSASPFSKPAIGEPGGETASATVLAVTGANAIVDWVFLELRSASNPSMIVATKRALIQRDGDIVSNIDGTSPVFFAGTSIGNYFVSIKHRNHIGVMTPTTILLNDCAVANIDWTIDSVYTKVTLVKAPRTVVQSSTINLKALWSADCNTNKNVKYNGLSNDKDAILNTLGGVPNASLDNIYRREDANMDGKVRYNNTDNDRVLIINNIGTSSPNAIIFQHTPN